MTSSFIGKVFDNYRLLENLGIGGMGIVFKAIHIKLDKLLALKMIAPGLAMNENFINRFQTEAKALAKLEDPNIVRIYDLRSDNDQWFIVMEYVDGSNLSDKLKHDGAYDWKEALPILKQILTAIGHAHASGIIHRDMKPNNVMINKDGQVKITDFGLAKDQTNIGSTITMTSGGTLFYMSPEHVKGLSFTDKRSDIYSIGMTLYEMITGNVPFKNIDSDFDIRESIIRKDFDKPTKYNPDVPAELEAIIMKSIAKNPDKRFQSADEMLTAINEFEELSGISDDGSIATNAQKSSKMRIRAKTTGTKHYRKGIYFGITGAVATTLLLIFILTADFFSYNEKDENTLKPAQLTIRSAPDQAVIYLNSDSIGLTPLQNYLIEPGNYLVHLKNTAFKVVDTTIHIKESSDLDLSFTMQPAPIKRLHAMASVKPVKKETIALVLSASVTFNSKPAGADILIGGKLKGKTPLHIGELKPGAYNISIRKDGYEYYEQNIDLKSGKNPEIVATLSALSGGLLVVTTPVSAKIILDGMEINDPNRPLKMKGIPIGRHRIEITHEGYSSVIKNIDIMRNEVQKIEADLEQLMGELSVQVRPWGSIYINDNLQKASTDRKLTVKLPVTQYQLKVMHPTLGRWEKMIQLKSENKTEILVDFNRKKPITIGAVDEDGNPVYGEIYIDNQNTGKSTPEEVVVHQGLHKLIVKKDGYIAQNGEKEVLVDDNFSERLTFILKKVK